MYADFLFFYLKCATETQSGNKKWNKYWVKNEEKLKMKPLKQYGVCDPLTNKIGEFEGEGFLVKIYFILLFK